MTFWPPTDPWPPRGSTDGSGSRARTTWCRTARSATSASTWARPERAGIQLLSGERARRGRVFGRGVVGLGRRVVGQEHVGTRPPPGLLKLQQVATPGQEQGN